MKFNVHTLTQYLTRSHTWGVIAPLRTRPLAAREQTHQHTPHGTEGRESTHTNLEHTDLTHTNTYTNSLAHA